MADYSKKQQQKQQRQQKTRKSKNDRLSERWKLKLSPEEKAHFFLLRAFQNDRSTWRTAGDVADISPPNESLK